MSIRAARLRVARRGRTGEGTAREARDLTVLLRLTSTPPWRATAGGCWAPRGPGRSAAAIWSRASRETFLHSCGGPVCAFFCLLRGCPLSRGGSGTDFSRRGWREELSDRLPMNAPLPRTLPWHVPFQPSLARKLNGPLSIRRANLEHISQSRPDSGLDLSHFQYERLLTLCHLFPARSTAVRGFWFAACPVLPTVGGSFLRWVGCNFLSLQGYLAHKKHPPPLGSP